MAELSQALIVCYERTRQLLGSTECVLGSLLIELPGGGPSLASLPGQLTSLAHLAGSPSQPTWPAHLPSLPGQLTSLAYLAGSPSLAYLAGSLP